MKARGRVPRQQSLTLGHGTPKMVPKGNVVEGITSITIRFKFTRGRMLPQMEKTLEHNFVTHSAVASFAVVFWCYCWGNLQ